MVTAPDTMSSLLADKAPAIEVLSLGVGTEAVEHCVKAVRTLGKAVHAGYASSRDGVEQRLRATDTHILLVDAARSPIPISDLQPLLAAVRSDAVIVAVGGPLELLATALVRDRLNGEHDERLHWVVLREYGDLMTRRRLRHSQRRLQETEHRCDALMESSKEAIAYVHDGMHIRANAVYLELFDVGDQEAMEGLPLMDLVQKAPQRSEAVTWRHQLRRSWPTSSRDRMQNHRRRQLRRHD